MPLSEIRKKLKRLGSKKNAEVARRFFKTGRGEYGEGDVFIGVRVPKLRKLAKEYANLSLKEVKELLKSPVHEERLLALLLLNGAFLRGRENDRRKIYELYLKNTRFINNWDLVDCSAEHIVGAFLALRSRRPLYALARSDDMWGRRISILSTFRFIKRNEFSETLKIAGMLLHDEEDLIQKAVGWMLREVGKRDVSAEESFLRKHYKKMPRTMLRYAIERFPEEKRQSYLKGKI